MRSHKWSILIAVALVSFLGSMDGSIANAAVPTLMEELQTTFSTAQWILLAYLLGLTLFQVGMGRLADLNGRKQVFVSGVVLFLMGSALCSAAPNIYWLLGFRFLQSIGAAMMLALGSAILTATWQPSERGKAIGFTAGLIAFGIVIGPAIGGALIEWLGWRWIFYINLPIGLVALLLAWRFVPPLRPQASSETFDWLGAFVLGIGAVAAALGLTWAQTLGFSAPWVILLLLVAAISLPLFWRVEMQVKYPLIDLSLLRNRDFSRNLFTSWTAFAGIAGAVFLLPFYLQLINNYSARGVGLMMAILPLSMGILQPIAGALSDRIGQRKLILFGLASMTVGYYAMSTFQTGGDALGVILRVLPVSVGMACFYSPNNSAMMGLAPTERLGVASGVASMVRSLSQIMGIALSGAIFNWRVQLYSGATSVTSTVDPHLLTRALSDVLLMLAMILAVGLLAEMLGGRDAARRVGGALNVKQQG